MAFRGVPVIRIELRGGANFTKVYVRLPSAHSHYMLRALAPGHYQPTPPTSSHFGPASKSHFTLRARYVQVLARRTMLRNSALGQPAGIPPWHSRWLKPSFALLPIR